jgi:hypothetical protein
LITFIEWREYYVTSFYLSKASDENKAKTFELLCGKTKKGRKSGNRRKFWKRNEIQTKNGKVFLAEQNGYRFYIFYNVEFPFYGCSAWQI